MRFAPVLALLAFLVLVPGVLAHHCTSDDQQSGDEFSVQSMVAPSVSVPIIVGLLLVPLAIVGVLAAVLRGSGKQPPMSGQWVWTPEQWVFVESK